MAVLLVLYIPIKKKVTNTKALTIRHNELDSRDLGILRIA